MTTATKNDGPMIGEVLDNAVALKLNVKRMDNFRALFGSEADPLNENETGLKNAVLTAYGHYVAAGRAANTTLAPVVALIAEWVKRFKPSGKEVAELLMGVNPDMAKRSQLLQKNKRRDTGEKYVLKTTDVNRQNATRYLRLARWTNSALSGVWLKDETPTQYVEINGQKYQTPVDALADGHSMNSCDHAWGWAVKPSQNRSIIELDKDTPLPPLREAIADPDYLDVVASNLVDGMVVPYHAYDREKKQEVRQNLDVVTNGTALFHVLNEILGRAAKTGQAAFTIPQAEHLHAYINELTAAEPKEPPAATAPVLGAGSHNYTPASAPIQPGDSPVLPATAIADTNTTGTTSTPEPEAAPVLPAGPETGTVMEETPAAAVADPEVIA